MDSIILEVFPNLKDFMIVIHRGALEPTLASAAGHLVLADMVLCSLLGAASAILSKVQMQVLLPSWPLDS